MNELGQEQQQPQQANAPPPQRRPRVREVSSRFMSPVASSSSFSPMPNVKQQCADENRPTRAVVKLFKEPCPSSRSISRPDTPTVPTSSKLRLMQHRSTSSSNTVSAAAKLLQSTLLASNPSSSAHDNTNTLRSSMPEPNISARFLTERNMNRPNPTAPPAPHPSKVSRSLILQRSPSEQSLIFHSQNHTPKIPAPTLPPPPLTDPPRNLSKISSHQEDVHYLRLLHNRYLQWRYVNAKAQTSVQAQTRETQKTLYGIGVKVAELYDSVKRKRIELGLLQRTKVLSTILKAQMPYLDEWCTFEMDYSVSLSEAIQALLNTSLQVPINGNIRADSKEIGEALISATKLMETIALQIQSLMPKAEETESLASELARVTGGERALIEECGDQLSMIHKSQVEECSLRGQLIQLHRVRGI